MCLKTNITFHFQINFPNNYSVEHSYFWSVNGHSSKPYTLPSQVGVVDSDVEYTTPNAINLPDYLHLRI
jgi:hypothetical protein